MGGNEGDVPTRQPVVANIQYGGDYKAHLEEAQRTRECIFCRPDFRDAQKVLFRYDSWFARRNDYPTKDIDGGLPLHHFLIVSDRCFWGIEEYRPADILAVWQLFRMLRQEFAIAGGGLVKRFDDPLFSGATILHEHWHIIVPRVIELTPDRKPQAHYVNFPIG